MAGLWWGRDCRGGLAQDCTFPPPRPPPPHLLFPPPLLPGTLHPPCPTVAPAGWRLEKVEAGSWWDTEPAQPSRTQNTDAAMLPWSVVRIGWEKDLFYAKHLRVMRWGLTFMNFDNSYGKVSTGSRLQPTLEPVRVRGKISETATWRQGIRCRESVLQSAASSGTNPTPSAELGFRESKPDQFHFMGC